MGTSRLGNMLVEDGLLTEEDRRTIKRTCGTGGSAFAKGILAMGLLDEDELAAYIAEHTNWQVAAKNLNDHLQNSAWGCIDRPLVEQLEVLPIRLAGETLQVAMVDPLDGDTLQQLEFFSGFKIMPIIATLTQVRSGLLRSMPDYKPTLSQLEEFLQNHSVTASKRIKLSEENLYDDLPVLESFSAPRSGAITAPALAQVKKAPAAEIDFGDIEDEAEELSSSDLNSEQGSDLDSFEIEESETANTDDNLFSIEDDSFATQSDDLGDSGDSGAIDDLESDFENSLLDPDLEPTPAKSTKPTLKIVSSIGDEDLEDLMDLSDFDPDKSDDIGLGGDDLGGLTSDLDDLSSDISMLDVDTKPTAKKALKKVSPAAPVDDSGLDFGADIESSSLDDDLMASFDSLSPNPSESDPFADLGTNNPASPPAIDNSELSFEDDDLFTSFDEPKAKPTPAKKTAADFDFGDLEDSDEPKTKPAPTTDLGDSFDFGALEDSPETADLSADFLSGDSLPATTEPIDNLAGELNADFAEMAFAETGTDDVTQMETDDVDFSFDGSTEMGTDDVTQMGSGDVDFSFGGSVEDTPQSEIPSLSESMLDDDLDIAGDSGPELLKSGAPTVEIDPVAENVSSAINKMFFSVSMSLETKDAISSIASDLKSTGFSTGIIMSSPGKGEFSPQCGWTDTTGKGSAPTAESLKTKGISAALARLSNKWTALDDAVRQGDLKAFAALQRDKKRLYGIKFKKEGTDAETVIVTAMAVEIADNNDLLEMASDLFKQVAAKNKAAS